MKYEFEYMLYVCLSNQTVKDAKTANGVFGWEPVSYDINQNGIEIYFRRLIITAQIRKLIREGNI